MAATPQTISNLGARVPLLIQQGDTWGPFPIRVRNPDGSLIDRTGVTFDGHIRKRATDAGAPLAVFTFLPGDSTATAYVLLDAASASALSSGESVTDADSQHVYDWRMTDASGNRRTVCHGPAATHRAVTHA